MSFSNRAAAVAAYCVNTDNAILCAPTSKEPVNWLHQLFTKRPPREDLETYDFKFTVCEAGRFSRYSDQSPHGDARHA